VGTQDCQVRRLPHSHLICHDTFIACITGCEASCQQSVLHHEHRKGYTCTVQPAVADLTAIQALLVFAKQHRELLFGFRR
jgi:hypothetical protein